MTTPVSANIAAFAIGHAPTGVFRAFFPTIG
jgi:hypothetical protein